MMGYWDETNQKYIPLEPNPYFMRGGFGVDKSGIIAFVIVGCILLFTTFWCIRAVIECYEINEFLIYDEENNDIATVGLSQDGDDDELSLNWKDTTMRLSEDGDDDELSLDWKDTEDIEANTTSEAT